MLDGSSRQLRIRHEIAGNLHLFAQSRLNPGRVLGRGWDPHHGCSEPIGDISPGVGSAQHVLGDAWVGDGSEECSERLPGQSEAVRLMVIA